MLMSALVVDDEASMRQLLAGTIRSLGVEQIFEAENAEQALILFEQENLQLVFLDLNMPGESGFSVLEKMILADPGAHVVIVSGNSDISNVQKAISLGAKGFIVKPYQGAKIKDALGAYRKKRLN